MARRWASSGSAWCAACAVLAVYCLFGGAAAASASEAGPVAAWEQRLGRIESRLAGLPGSDTGAGEDVARDLAALRLQIERWLADHPSAQEDGQPWLAPSGAGTGVEDLAAEVGRLRAAISRIAASLTQGSGEGAFYLGRIDVAVTAQAAAPATTEMTPAGATVVSAQDLQANDRTTLAGALALAPGVTFVRIGQRNETSVYVRGFDMRQVPLFIDGIPIYTPYDGTVDLERFTTFDTAELRVSKGFASAVHGPNAIGGAINIVSRRPAARLEGLAGAGYGSGSSRNVFLNAGSRVKSFYVQGSASYLDSDTFPLADGFTPVKTQPAGGRVNADKRDGRFSAKIGWTPGGADEYAVSYVGQRGRKGNPPYAGADASVKTRYWKWPYWDKDSVYFLSNTQLGSLGCLRGRAYYDTYDNALHSYDDATYTTQARSSSFRSLYHDTTAGGSLEWRTTVGKQTLRVAGHLKADRHEDHNSGEPLKRFEGRIVSVGVEDTFAASPRLSVVAGISADWQATTRAEDYQKSKTIDLLADCRADGASCGDATGVNPQLGVFYGLGSGLARFTVARKTRMPTLKDRYSYKLGTAVPNPDLDSERSLTVEAGYQGALGRTTSFQATAFYSRIDDLIQRIYLSANLSQLRNIGRARHAGLELDVRTGIVPGVELGANYTYLDRENLSDPSTPLVDTPRHKGRISASGAIVPAVRVMANVEFEADRRTQNEAGRYLDMPSFATLNVKAVWTVLGRLDAELGVSNAFDRAYWMADGYPEAGRTVLTTLRWRF